jgi:hypothetical protein
MTIRIPPSLKWLVVKRATLAGQISLQLKNFEAQIGELEAKQEKLVSKKNKTLTALRRDLAAIDRSIRMHEILINPKLIEATRVQSQPCKTAHGSITKAIYKVLALSAPKAATTGDVTDYVIENCGFDKSPAKYQSVRIKVQHRLKDLVKQGSVCRLHSARGANLGVWCEPASFEALRHQQSRFDADSLGNTHRTTEKSQLS